MSRKAALLLLSLFVCATAFARTRAVSSDNATRPSGATVSGFVTSVSGNVITLADGHITLDASDAKIVVGHGGGSTIADIKPGMLVFAALKSNEVAANAPLPAAMITATRFPDATLFGPVTAIDLTASTFVVLGRTIHVDANTSFGGFRTGSAKPGLADLLPNQIVQVQLDSSATRLLATSVIVVAPAPQTFLTTRGKVKSISSNEWVLSRERERHQDLTLVVDANTKIIGNPKVGDEVEVLYREDSARNNIAISIVKFERPNETTLVRGKVLTKEATAWTIAVHDDALSRVLINERTKIGPGINVGDRVEVLAQRNDAGELVALLIIELPF